MRITQSMYYQNLNPDRSGIAQKLFDVNKQISSGSKIQYAYESPTTFVDTLRLDDEIKTFDQVISSVNSGSKFSQQTDSTIGEFTKTLDQFKTKLIQAASSANSDESMQALASELRGIESHLRDLANTSVNGQYIFSGSLVDQKPIDQNGDYHGNGDSMTSFLGSNVRQAYNISGSDLFLGEESTTQRKITTNVKHLNQTLLYPDVMVDPTEPRSSATEQYITESDTIRDLVGDNDNVVDTVNSQNHFYISGTKHDGSTFKTTIDMKDDETVGDLIDKIGKAFGNTSANQVVNVSLNAYGQIEIQDNLPGSSKLDFHMVANVDPAGAVTNLDTLNSNGTRVVEFTKSEISGYQTTVGQQRNPYNPDSFILNMDMRTKTSDLVSPSTLLTDVFRSDISSISFGGTKTDGSANADTFNVTATSTVQDLVTALKTSYQVAPDDLDVSIVNGRINFSTTSGQNNIDMQLTANDAASNPLKALSSNASIDYDNAKFTKSGSHLLSNVPQIVKADNSYATDQTKLSDVAAYSPFVDAGSALTQQLKLDGIDINGNPFNAQIDLAEGGSTFSLDGGATNYTIYNMDTPRTAVNGNDMTYKQLTDVINMIVSNNLPAITAPATTNTDAEYDAAITSSLNSSVVTLDNKGQINFEQTSANTTKADISLYDANSTDFTKGGSALEFNANSSLTISDPKTDFFAQIDEVIKSVEQKKMRADTQTGDLRNVGIQNAIQMIDDLNSHMSKEQAKSGVQSQSLQTAADRTQMLKLSSTSMRSDVIDTDIADATLTLNQLQLNYQAIYSSLSKVSKLSLVNYL
ncbi:flagellar hook-associated protein FlgL [Sulfurimonas sp. HSL-1716]|uniref:flagellar hook-associated protein FlgL n=1 Tax=Hydrocurvibacter sulfurireducens TaxID=3131937 RepID=UPI0031F85028